MSQGYAAQAVKATGLNIWASGENSETGPEVDVIAIQGLGAHPYYTWVWKPSSTKNVKPKTSHPFGFLQSRQKNAANGLLDVAQTVSDTEEVMWLRDFLPDLIPNARIATYSFDSDWRKADVKTSLRKCGEQLLNVLRQNRSKEKECQRPLVFIGHSLGGLVIKQALVLADHGHEFKNIRLSTAGIIFLGTPHQGTDAAVYGVWLAQAVRHDKTLLESLKRNSPALYDIARDFDASYSNADIVCFYEDRDTSYGPWRTQFADRQSATLHGKRAIYLSTDHSGLNKFRGPKDDNFLLVWPEIENIVQMAPQRIKECYRSHAVSIEKESFHVDFSLQGIPVVKTFVAREAEMTRLTEVLLPSSTDQMRRKVFIVHGLGGIGKTQLSVEFAREYKGSYSAVLWIDGSTNERLRRSIADLASRLPQHQLSEESRSYSQSGRLADVDEVVKDVLAWLSRPSNDQWLLIFDNVDREFSGSSRDPEAFDVTEYFPTADQGSILITSRLASLLELGQDIKLKPVNEVQGESILKNNLGRSVKDSSKLVNLLQGLPLAINQAGSYMRKTGTNVSEYIELYDQTWERLMKKQHHSTLRENADRSILTTWTLSFNSLRSRSEDAANLLMLWAFLDNQDLWYELFAPALNLAIADELPHWFVSCASHILEFNERIELLLEYSFIDAKTESSSFSMHSVLHHWCFHTFEAKSTMSWLAVIIVASAVPFENVLHYSLTQRRLLPHCDHVYLMLQRYLQEAFENREYLSSLSNACHWLGYLYSNQGKIKEAEDMYLRALTGSEKVWGPEHTSTLDTVNNLANLYSNQGKMKEAEDMYLRALTGFKKAWGSEHTSTLNTVNNLGALYKNQGKMKEAEDMYLRALTGYEKAWGSEHTSTLDTVHNLGALYSNQGKMKEAEDMYLRALRGFEKTWGSEHTSTLATVNNLGILYSNQGKMKEAENMYLRALRGFEKTWGSEHTSTLATVNNLGILYKDQGKMKEAEDMYLRALTGKEKAWGSEHTSTLDTVHNLGILYSNQGKMKEAEDMLLRAVTGKEKARGLEHKDCLHTRYYLGHLYKAKSLFGNAIQQFELVVAGYTKLFGPEHSKTVNALDQLDFCEARLEEKGEMS